MNVKNFLSPQEEEQVIAAIKEAELETSGEIRVHLESRCWGNPLKKGLKTFRKLSMDKTAAKNGVLFFVAVKNHKIAIVADKGINDVVPENFWDDVYEEIKGNFRSQAYSKGLVDAILKTGVKLKEHFPYQSDDVNELPDEISRR